MIPSTKYILTRGYLPTHCSIIPGTGDTAVQTSSSMAAVISYRYRWVQGQYCSLHSSSLRTFKYQFGWAHAECYRERQWERERERTTKTGNTNLSWRTTASFSGPQPSCLSRPWWFDCQQKHGRILVKTTKNEKKYRYAASTAAVSNRLLVL